MVSSFRRESPVLYFRPRAHVTPGERRYLLWPAWAWRVVAPRRRERRLNVLQKAVLGLGRAGIVTAERVGPLLRIDPQLAALIASELQQQQLLDHRGLATDKGLRALQEEQLDTHDFVAGFVFQDPWTGELWPRFIEQLEFAQVEFGADGFPDLVLGTTGRPWRQSAYMHLPGAELAASAPDAGAILQVTRRHQQALRRAEALPDWDEDDGSDFEPGTVLFDRVSLIEDAPRPVFLTTFLYLPNEAAEDGDWHVCDPFGLGESLGLRRAVERQMERVPRLRERVQQLLKDSVNGNVEALRSLTEQLRTQARLEVERALTLDVHRLPCFDSLVDMEFALQEAQLLGANCPEQKLRGALLDGRRVLESLFAHIRDRHSTTGVWRRLNEDNLEFNREVFNRTAGAMGLETPIPRELTDVKRGLLKSVADHRNTWRLRPMIAAALLAARDDAHHPLRLAARTEPRLLMELEAIASAAGGELHAGAGGGRLSMALVADMVRKVFRVTSLLTELASRHP